MGNKRTQQITCLHGEGKACLKPEHNRQAALSVVYNVKLGNLLDLRRRLLFTSSLWRLVVLYQAVPEQSPLFWSGYVLQLIKGVINVESYKNL